MLKGQNIKDNLSCSSGKVSCLLLLLLAFLMITPMATSASALEGEETREPETNYDNQASAQADSGVTIAFTPSSGSASLTPTSSAGASAKIDISANVKIASTGGYTIYLSGQNAALTGASTGQTIAGATTATTFTNMKTNTWGYAAVEGISISDNATYTALPQGQGVKLGEGNGNATDIDRTFAISFATKIGNDKPADTYSNQVTLSVTSSPLQVSLSDISELQQITSDHCSGTAEGFSKQLKDTRDGKYYWVSKLADGKCWMTQNLDLDLSTSKALTSADSDVSANWTPGFNTASQATSSTVNSNSQTETRSWSLGNYRITNPTTSSDCGYPKNDLSQCTSQFTAYNTPTTANGDANAHYIVGNHYQWNAATAGTGGSITSGQATSSICPKGWRLPTSTSSGEFQVLINAYSIGSDVAKLTSSPLYFVRGGGVYQSTSNLFRSAGYEGGYWSSTPASNRSLAYDLNFWDTNSLNPSGTNARNSGYSVRCLAR